MKPKEEQLQLLRAELEARRLLLKLEQQYIIPDRKIDGLTTYEEFEEYKQYLQLLLTFS